MSIKSKICVGIALAVLAVVGPVNTWARSVQEADAIIRRAYNDYLGRDPDPTGLKTYRHLLVDENWSEDRVRKEVKGSAEAKGKDDPGLVVNRAYRAVLGRDADAEGLKSYSRRVQEDGWGQSEIEKSLKKSDEYRQNVVDVMIKRAYRDVLGRDPDQAGLENYRKPIIENNWSENDVRNALKKSPEYKNRKK